MRTDVHAWIGDYPYRALGAPGVEALINEMDALEIACAWVGALPAAFRRDPRRDNETLYAELAPHGGRLAPVPAIRPDLPAWEHDLETAAEWGAPAVRAYPPQWGLATAGGAMQALAGAAASLGLPLILTVGFEDVRQRHPLDVAGQLAAADVRALVRAVSDLRLILTAAGRAMVEEVHWGSTAPEAARIWWDVSHLWGPPEDDLGHVVRTMGAERFLLGTHWPLRIGEGALAKLDLLDLSPADRAQIEGENARRVAGPARASHNTGRRPRE